MVLPTFLTMFVIIKHPNLRLTSIAKYNETIRLTVVIIILNSFKSEDVKYNL